MAVPSSVRPQSAVATSLLEDHWRALLPLALLLGLVLLLAHGLQRDPRTLPSALVGQPAPSFKLPRLEAPHEFFTNEALRGRPWVLNVWASWRGPCREELPQLQQLTERGVPVVGLNYKDEATAAQRWLEIAGRVPFEVAVRDIDGRAALDWGVGAVPAIFIVDAQGIVRWRFAGAMTPQVLQREFWPLWKKLHRQGGPTQ